MDTVINGINITHLEQSMSGIDWKNAFDLKIKKQLSPEDIRSWENEQKVESVIEDLLEIEKSEDGKALSILLKLKYWAGVPYQEIFGNISPVKNKSEVRQRFYLFEGQTGISVDEAYRFLLNRWLEKQMQEKRKELASQNGEELSEGNHSLSGSVITQKKRLSNTKRASKKNSHLKK